MHSVQSLSKNDIVFLKELATYQRIGRADLKGLINRCDVTVHDAAYIANLEFAELIEKDGAAQGHAYTVLIGNIRSLISRRGAYRISYFKTWFLFPVIAVLCGIQVAVGSYGISEWIFGEGFKFTAIVVIISLVAYIYMIRLLANE